MKAFVVALHILAICVVEGVEPVVLTDGMEVACNLRKQDHARDKYTPEYSRLRASESKHISGAEFQEGAELLIRSIEEEVSLIATEISPEHVSNPRAPTPDEITRKAELLAAFIRLFRKFEYKTETKQISVVPITAIRDLQNSPHFQSDFLVEFEMKVAGKIWRTYFFIGEFLQYFETPPDGLFDDDTTQAGLSQFVFHRFE